MDCDIASYHVDSFNYLVDHGLNAAALSIPPVTIDVNGELYQIAYQSAHLGRPNVAPPKLSDPIATGPGNLFPAECRQRALSYRAPLRVVIDLRAVGGQRMAVVESFAGEVPVMLRSKACNLYGLSAEKLVERGEEAIEKGGYFVCKGSEKVMRLLVANKRNFPLALERPGMKEKGRLFSQYAVMMRSIRGNHSAAIINVHYLENASIVLAIQYEREIFYVPLMYVLKCLTTMTDRAIYDHMTRGRPGDSFWAGCVTNMLSMAQSEGVKTSQDALVELGSRFRVVLEGRYGKTESNTAMTRHLLRACVCIHLDTDEQKFHCLVMMAQKLIALVKNEIQPESLDNPQFQEASISGHIMLLIIRERLERMLLSTRRRIEYTVGRSASFNFTSDTFVKAYDTTKGEISNGLEYFLATGNLITQNGLGLMQKNGFAVIAERINQLRFVSHFRAIHRGAFFMEMRTTDVRKLRPEAWGFICPVHTPDGAPCGLLNHVTASCRIVTHYSSTEKLRALLSTAGVIGHRAENLMFSDQPTYPVILDGEFFGYVPRNKAALIARYLRQVKVDAKDKRVPYTTEIALIRASADPAHITSQFPGLYIYTGPGRFIRPVRNLASKCTEYIGIFEQVYLSIVIDLAEAEPDVTMHQELHPSGLFSFTGNLIPFPDHNQSPRNVYQCQMGKQTMGVPVHAWRTRADGKMYLIQTPQDPLIKLAAYDKYDMKDYPLGTHACVAVISYTGYDMEDAMVINRGSYQRGLAHGSVLKVERIDLTEKRGFMKTCDRVFYANPKERLSTIGEDGLPIPGRVYKQGDVYYSVFDRATGEFITHVFKYAESMWCASVRIVYDDDSRDAKTHALIQWRIPRNPIIGDKFASRHGQKGINSFLWPSESLPFSESGMVPDIVFNPHGFPSRMTIGMMIESMAGKAACMHGQRYDASPFVYDEKNTAIKHFGDLLTEAGYNYMGNETMYSGVDGSMMEVQIFFGVVYYQRLRHMISDKFQVRATGKVDPVTMQPIKGRKVGGGIRFGEMERDALIAHGTAFCLQDRLFNCSDKDEAWVCASCGSITSVTTLQKRSSDDVEFVNGNGPADYDSLMMNCNGDHKLDKKERRHNFTVRHCTVCDRTDNIHLMQVPRVFRYLCAELSAMNVRICLDVVHPKDVFRS